MVCVCVCVFVKNCWLGKYVFKRCVENVYRYFWIFALLFLEVFFPTTFSSPFFSYVSDFPHSFFCLILYMLDCKKEKPLKMFSFYYYFLYELNSFSSYISFFVFKPFSYLMSFYFDFWIILWKFQTWKKTETVTKSMCLNFPFQWFCYKWIDFSIY